MCSCETLYISRTSVSQTVEKTFQLSRSDRETVQRQEYELQVCTLLCKLKFTCLDPDKILHILIMFVRNITWNHFDFSCTLMIYTSHHCELCVLLKHCTLRTFASYKKSRFDGLRSLLTRIMLVDLVDRFGAFL
jgi:hypothetical protein